MNKKLSKKLISFLCILVVFTAGYLAFFPAKAKDIFNDNFFRKSEYSLSEGVTTVEAIDVGQGDCFLVRNSTWGNILIDAGENGKEDIVISALKKRGVKKIDILIATHPHSDHIGGAAEVVNEFEIGSVYMPKAEHDTKTYYDMLEAVRNKGIKINEVYEGVEIDLRNGEKIEFLSPERNDTSTDLNDLSAVFLLTTQGKEILFTGDSGVSCEKRYVKKLGNIDILKVSHHGSSLGNSEVLIKKIKPEYALIGVGKNNDYGHPHKETMQLFKKYSVKVYRTDLNGDILLKIENGEITAQSEK